VTRFVEATLDVLLALGVPAAVVEVERREMQEVRIGKTASRQVLGSMNDFANLMDAFREAPGSRQSATCAGAQPGQPPSPSRPALLDGRTG